MDIEVIYLNIFHCGLFSTTLLLPGDDDEEEEEENHKKQNQRIFD